MNPTTSRTLTSCIAVLGLVATSLRAQVLLHELSSSTPVTFGSFGLNVSGVPDLSGDGIRDILISADGEDEGGHVHVFNGATGTEIYRVGPGTTSGDFFGLAAAGTPDLDGDGKGDFAAFTQVGQTRHLVEVHSGATGGFLYALESPHNDFQAFGRAISGVADVDGDGAGEILIGASREGGSTRPNAGRGYLFSGATASLLDELTSPHPERGAQFGYSTATVPDIDGDGIAELAFGAPYDSVTRRSPGRAYVYSGATGSLLLELTPPHQHPGGAFGFAVAGLNDIDGDGHGDVAIGAPFETPAPGLEFAGQVHVFSGTTGRLLYTLVSPNPVSKGFFGKSLARLLDTDGDGQDDLLVGSPPFLAFTFGRCFVFNGVTGALQYQVSSPAQGTKDLFGISVAGLEDLDGDGRGDFVVGSHTEGNGGRANVYSGALTAN